MMRFAVVRPVGTQTPEFLHLLRGKDNLESFSKDELVEVLDGVRQARNEYIRRAVLAGNDEILATEALGYKVAPKLHRRVLKHWNKHKKTLTIAYRGSGKSTMVTVKCIGLILRNRNIRILLPSKSHENARSFLHEIKQHLESNPRFREIFGDLVGDGIWTESAIEIAGRTAFHREPTINTVGAEGSVASKHYDVIFADDIVDNENARTQLQRDRIQDWFLRVLYPCLMPPDPSIPERGQLHVMGTLYHDDDLYAHLEKGLMKDSTLNIPGIDAAGRVPWPQFHNRKWMDENRRVMGIVHFGTQILCTTEVMKGSIFRPTDCQIVQPSLYPKDLKVFLGVDLAISLKRGSNKFAIVAIGICPRERIWTLAAWQGHLRFHEQTQKIMDWAKRFEPIRTAVESVGYQAAQCQELNRKAPWLNLIPVPTKLGKPTRGWTLASRFENGDVFFMPTQTELIDHLVLFRGDETTEDDLFDAFDLAVTASQKRARRPRREYEPGVI